MSKNGNLYEPDLSVFENGNFWSPTIGSLTISKVIDETRKFILTSKESSFRVIIGTDSQSKKNNGDFEIDFVSAIVVHRLGYGGRYFWHKIRQRKKYILRDKIYTETWLSLQLAEKLVPELRRVIPDNKYDLEIHVDVGPNGPTRDMIKEVVGMVTGSGYTAKTKPESFGASSIADKHT